ncbi:hypothetical protein VP01_424g3 [Puccinia sorghi]|uniref:Uncharacterized protein n=1 Tax=Puccinia sorghi TaxID=27349 RepID=A0A0L6UQF7_9BASI|nr:hypothetical protein VP01_424g3 [Puccinia sorghi]
MGESDAEGLFECISATTTSTVLSLICPTLMPRSSGTTSTGTLLPGRSKAWKMSLTNHTILNLLKETWTLPSTTFRLLVEVSMNFDKTTLEAVGVIFALKRLPLSFSVFRSLQFAGFKTNPASLSMDKFLTDLELEVRRQREKADKLVSSSLALAVSQAQNLQSGLKGSCPKICSKDVHNPETAHSPNECFQLHPEKAITFYQAAIDRVSKHRANLL